MLSWVTPSQHMPASTFHAFGEMLILFYFGFVPGEKDKVFYFIFLQLCV